VLVRRAAQERGCVVPPDFERNVLRMCPEKSDAVMSSGLKSSESSVTACPSRNTSTRSQSMVSSVSSFPATSTAQPVAAALRTAAVMV
jgi:hypothetical protein